MWTLGCLRTVLRRFDAHEKLMRKKLTKVLRSEQWINGYEFGLFAHKREAIMLGETMHIQGLIIDDVVSPFVYELALSHGHAENIRCMEHIRWNVQILEGIVRRPDAFILLRGMHAVNGYEYALLYDTHLSKIVGQIMRYRRIPFSSVIRYSVFQQSPTNNIKAMMVS